MSFSITSLSCRDLQCVDTLMKENSATLGFLPLEALADYAGKGGLIGAKSLNDELVAYMLFSSHPGYFRIVHLCVSERCRGNNIARELVNHLRSIATTQLVVKLHCRRDFPAHLMWPKLGFVPMDEKPGRSAAGHLLTLWWRTLASDRQLDIFQALITDEHINAVIDAQIFFDLFEPPSPKSLPSQALLSDFLVDNINLWITDELFVEIDRNEDRERRNTSRERAHALPNVRYDPYSSEYFETQLKQLLPSTSTSKISDIRHLAKTAASELDIFVTRDTTLLKHADEINKIANVNVLSPTELLVSLRRYSDERRSTVARISGEDLSWRDLRVDDLSRLSEACLLEPDERAGPAKEKLNAYLAEPARYTCKLLQLGERIVALRVMGNDANAITCDMMRISRRAEGATIDRFAIADTLAAAIETNKKVVNISREGASSHLVTTLTDMGFVASADAYIRCVLPNKMTRTELLGRLYNATPELRRVILSVTDLELERHCSPIYISEARPSFLIPIKPAYAMGLFDTKQATSDLFGARQNTLLRWENVYYRSATHKSMIRAPGRIFWYASGPQSAVVAVSLLDEVVLGKPKELFRAFEQFGVLDWRAIFEMCKGNVSAELMALKFSHTFPFRTPIELRRLREIFAEKRVGFVVQSPAALPEALCRAIFEVGFET